MYECTYVRMYVCTNVRMYEQDESLENGDCLAEGMPIPQGLKMIRRGEHPETGAPPEVKGSYMF